MDELILRICENDECGRVIVRDDEGVCPNCGSPMSNFVVIGETRYFG